jgi:UPF0716 family protein affecting phage T7 exclusion
MTSRAPYPYEPPHDGQDTGRTADTGQTPGAGQRRPRGRTFLPLAVAAWALLEIWLLTLIADAAGGFAVLGLLVAGFVLGVYVVKRAGRRAWRRLTESVQQTQQAARSGQTPPAPEQSGGGNALTMLGGLLIVVPGVLSDAAGLLCLFPPTAALLRRRTRRFLDRRSGFAPGTLGDAYQQARRAEDQMRMHRPDGKTVQGEVVRDDEPPAHH